MNKENNNDLISRSELKNAILEHRDDYVEDNFFWTKLFDLIDNAPMVEAFTEDDKALAYCEGYVRGSHEAYTKPQGEWIFLKANEEQTDGYECSVCKATFHTRVPYFSEFNFCPNCGAKMES